MTQTDQLLRRLPSAYLKTEKSNLYRLLSIFAEQFTDTEETIEDIKDARFLTKASGKSLDNIGILFNLTRKSEEADDEFRARISNELAICLSCGTKEDILNLVAYITGLKKDEIKIIERPEADIGYGTGGYGNNIYDSPRATFRIELLGEYNKKILVSSLYEGIKRVKAAGIYFQEDETKIGFDIRTLVSSQGEEIWNILCDSRYGFNGYGGEAYGRYLAFAIAKNAIIDYNIENEGIVNAYAITEGIITGIGGYGYGEYGCGEYGHGGTCS